MRSNTLTGLQAPAATPTSLLAALAYDETSGKVIRLGVVTTKVTDTWAYDSKSNSWTDLKPSWFAAPVGCAFDDVRPGPMQDRAAGPRGT